MLVFKLAAAILVCACAANAFKDMDRDDFQFEQADRTQETFDFDQPLDDRTVERFDQFDLGRKDTFRSRNPFDLQRTDLDLVKKLVSQLDGFVKYAEKLVLTGGRHKLKEVLKELKKYAAHALDLAKKTPRLVPYLVLYRLERVYALANRLKLLLDAPVNVLYQELDRLDNLVRLTLDLLGLPVFPDFDLTTPDLKLK